MVLGLRSEQGRRGSTDGGVRSSLPLMRPSWFSCDRYVANGEPVAEQPRVDRHLLGVSANEETNQLDWGVFREGVRGRRQCNLIEAHSTARKGRAPHKVLLARLGA